MLQCLILLLTCWMMGSLYELFLIIVVVVGASAVLEDICTNQWEISVEGVPSEDLTVHHSSTFVPGIFTHLVWNWRYRSKSSATLWLTQHRNRAKFQGGFIAQSRSLFHLPASFTWTLVNGSLAVTTHGNSQELEQFPPWSITVCEDLLEWGVTGDKDLFIIHDGANENRSLDESWAVESRIRRQAEFPTSGPDELPTQPQPPSTTGLAAWWRRFLDTIGASSRDDKPRSWLMDLTDFIFKMIFSSGRGQNSNIPPNIPTNPDAEVLPRRDVEPFSEATFPEVSGPRKVH